MNVRSGRWATSGSGDAGDPPPDGGLPALSPAGPDVILGGADPLAGSVPPTRHSLFGPRGAWLFGEDGPLWIADTGHHRLLGWARRPRDAGEPADWVLGQPDFTSEGRNADRLAGPDTLHVPTRVAPYGGGGMVVADGFNHRVLIWFEVPRESHVPADLVLGQHALTLGRPNGGTILRATASTMHWPFGVLAHQDRLYVADTGNRRILVWRELPGPGEHGRAADFALGQRSRSARLDNDGRPRGAGPATLRWPHDLAVSHGRLAVADAGNHRVQIFAGIPERTFEAATTFLGQPDAEGLDARAGHHEPHAGTLHLPSCLAATAGGWLLVGDTADSRIVAWPPGSRTGAPAVGLAGQLDFRTRGDARAGEDAPDRVSWPRGIQILERLAVVADTGNHRVQLWPLADGIE